MLDARQRIQAVAQGLYSISLTAVIPGASFATRYTNQQGVIMQDMFKTYSRPRHQGGRLRQAGGRRHLRQGRARHGPRRLPGVSRRRVEDRLRLRGLPEPRPRDQVPDVPGLQGAPLLRQGLPEEGLEEAPGLLQGRPGAELGRKI
jgi:hypothetical protein